MSDPKALSPEAGVAKFFGTWPGDETDKQLLDALQEVRHPEAGEPARLVHKTVAIQVWADVDEGIVEMVRYLNTIPGVRTEASCQGTLGEGGPVPYRAQVLTRWDSAAICERLKAEFDYSETEPGKNIPNGWCYLHPREGWSAPPNPVVRIPDLDDLYYKVREERERAGTDKDKELLHYDQRCAVSRQLLAALTELQQERTAHERTRAELEVEKSVADLAVAELASLRSERK